MSTPNFEEEERSVRANNRVLRISNRKIRERERAVREQSEALSFALIESDANASAAQEALGKLWRSGLVDTGPQDYDLMVEIAVEALKRVDTARTQDPSI